MSGATRPKILVTNDDGIDSVGLHVLAQSLTHLGEVVVVAPDREFSGAGAAIGALHVGVPEVHTSDVPGVDEAWAVSGPPALCVFYARLGAFGEAPDLIVSGINPGVNVGRSVYHSGTIGACLTGRNGGISGIAVSQRVPHWGIEGQGWTDMLADQKWQSAADVAAVAAEAMLNDPSEEPAVLNLNVPNVPIEEVLEWCWTEVGVAPPRAMSKATLKDKPGHAGAFTVDMDWGEDSAPPVGSDTEAVMADKVAATWLGRIRSTTIAGPKIDVALDGLLAR